ncbi:MAG: hypothetical protein MRK01_16530 [Candidatus Scalindua sp.]|nr:hypothetical protein [Candidatus Scalindua sp.]
MNVVNPTNRLRSLTGSNGPFQVNFSFFLTFILILCALGISLHSIQAEPLKSEQSSPDSVNLDAPTIINPPVVTLPLAIIDVKKNRINPGIEFPTLAIGKKVIDVGFTTEWRYFEGVKNPPDNWNRIDFDDSKWKRGKSGFGYSKIGENPNIKTDLAAMQGNYKKLFVRRDFAVNDVNKIEKIFLKLNTDSAFRVFLNGIKIIENSAKLVESFDISAWEEEMHKGRNVLSIEVLNDDINSNDFYCNPQLQIYEIKGAQ